MRKSEKSKEEKPATLRQISRLFVQEREFNKHQMFSLLEAQQVSYKQWTKDFVLASHRQLENSLKDWFEIRLNERLNDFQESLLEGLHEMLIKDRIEPLEKRVTKLEHKLI